MTHDPIWNEPMPEPPYRASIPDAAVVARHGMAQMVLGAINMLGVITGSYTEDDLIVMVILLEEALDGTAITRGEHGAHLATLRQHTETMNERAVVSVPDALETDEEG